MTDWTVHLEFEEGTSSKFWRARVEGKTLYVNWGKIGTNGQTQVKDLADPAAAKREYDKLVAEKRKKGYVDAGASGARADDDADDTEDAAGDDGDDEAREAGDDDERPAPKGAGKSRSVAGPAASKPAPPAGAAAPAKPATAGKPAAPGHRLVLDAGGRKAETTLYLDGNTVRMDSRESYASPEAASKAFERLKKLLGGEGYKPG
jgi:predicted DNA-binding WGR domain protein